MNQDLSSNPLRQRLIYMQVSVIWTNRVLGGVASPSAGLIGLSAFSLLTVEWRPLPAVLAAFED